MQCGNCVSAAHFHNSIIMCKCVKKTQCLKNSFWIRKIHPTLVDSQMIGWEFYRNRFFGWSQTFHLNISILTRRILCFLQYEKVLKRNWTVVSGSLKMSRCISWCQDNIGWLYNNKRRIPKIMLWQRSGHLLTPTDAFTAKKKKRRERKTSQTLGRSPSLIHSSEGED